MQCLWKPATAPNVIEKDIDKKSILATQIRAHGLVVMTSP